MITTNCLCQSSLPFAITYNCPSFMLFAIAHYCPSFMPFVITHYNPSFMPFVIAHYCPSFMPFVIAHYYPSFMPLVIAHYCPSFMPFVIAHNCPSSVPLLLQLTAWLLHCLGSLYFYGCRRVVHSLAGSGARFEWWVGISLYICFCLQVAQTVNRLYYVPETKQRVYDDHPHKQLAASEIQEMVGPVI